jgi:hypothetical protein
VSPYRHRPSVVSAGEAPLKLSCGNRKTSDSSMVLPLFFAANVFGAFLEKNYSIQFWGISLSLSIAIWLKIGKGGSNFMKPIRFGAAPSLQPVPGPTAVPGRLVGIRCAKV